MKRNFQKIILPIGIAVLLVVSGCYSYHFRDPGPARPFQEPTEPIEIFEYDRSEVRVKLYPQEEKTAQYDLYKIKFKVRDFEELNKTSVMAYWFAPKDTTEPKPLVIVMPPTGGPYSISLSFGRYLADRGFACLCLQRRERFFKPENDIPYHKNLFRQSVIDIRRGIDWAVTQPGVDQERIGILGVSLGGVLSQLAMQADQRIRSGVILLSGQDLPQILDTSGYIVVKRYRQALMKKLDLDQKSLVNLAEKTFREVDPKSFNDRIDPAKVLMVSGRYDNIIRYEVTKATWENMGHPELFVIPSGHYSSVFYRSLSMNKIYNHLLKTLALPLKSIPKEGEKRHETKP